MAPVAIPIRVQPELRDRIDAIRGDLTRSEWMRRAIERAVTEAERGGASLAEDYAESLTVPTLSDAGAPLRTPRAKPAPKSGVNTARKNGCDHPKESRQSLGYMTRCTACGARL